MVGDSTVDGFSRVLKHLSRHVDINSPEEVLDFVTTLLLKWQEEGVLSSDMMRKKERAINCH